MKTPTTPESDENIVIIGAGPAGLGTAYELTKKAPVPNLHIIDRNDVVGGLARTHAYKGYSFDVGPHRFFTKNQEVLQLWKDVLGDDFITVNRLTRILYNKKLFNYPIKLQDVIKKLGLKDSIESALSYLYAKIAYRQMDPQTFEQWITKNFGSKLYRTFFKTYTEKVWGIPCSEIGSEWAAQRIKNLNFTEVIKTALLGSKTSNAKSLVDVFYYPRQGAGQMYEGIIKKATSQGAQLNLASDITKVSHNGKVITSVAYTQKGKSARLPVSHLFSSMPLTHFIATLDPLPPADVLQAAEKLYYRDHITVNLIVKKAGLFPDNWVYIHDPRVKMARIANYNNFSEAMTATSEHTAISVEYFVFKDDELWNMADEKLIALATTEMDFVGLLKASDVIDGFVVRESESYPTYYMGHKEYFDTLKKYVDQFSNLQLIGRGGMYKYNNMDHSIYSGLLAARNLQAGYKKYDVWAINEDADYLEEIQK